MLTQYLVEEELSIAYVHAVTARAKFALDHKRIDNDSVDVTISQNGFLTTESTLGSPELHIQLKATVNPTWIANGQVLSFPLPQKNYNDLRVNTMIPKILVVLCLPQNDDDWLSHSPDQLILRNCAYWVSLKGLAPLPTGQEHKSVHLPITNTFSPDSLYNIMLKLSKEEEL